MCLARAVGALLVPVHVPLRPDHIFGSIHYIKDFSVIYTRFLLLYSISVVILASMCAYVHACALSVEVRSIGASQPNHYRSHALFDATV